MRVGNRLARDLRIKHAFCQERSEAGTSEILFGGPDVPAFIMNVLPVLEWLPNQRRQRHPPPDAQSRRV